MTPNDYNTWASTHVWSTTALPRTWAGKRYNPSSTEFASAVKAFQIQALLPADSKLGPATWAKMQQVMGKESFGVDVSKYQGRIHWPSVSAAGYAFAVLKASEGQDYRDPTFTYNAREAPAAGLRTTFYHFGTPHVIAPGKTPVEDAQAEAEDFLSAITHRPPPSKLAFTSASRQRVADVWLDLEKPAPAITPQQGLIWLLSWITTVENEGYLVGLYTKDRWLDEEVYDYRRFVSRMDGTIRPFWVARYGSNSGRPEPQYSPNDKVPDE
jgi:GH25 family lysozyme M1 (1,4-beta-N-acetylmuramidase)